MSLGFCIDWQNFDHKSNGAYLQYKKWSNATDNMSRETLTRHCLRHVTILEMYDLMVC